jgi:hypothetical protein
MPSYTLLKSETMKVTMTVAVTVTVTVTAIIMLTPVTDNEISLIA